MLTSILITHIVTGAIALLAGYAVIFLQKGKAAHKLFGRIYVVAMLALGLSGTYVAVVREIPLSMLNGLVLCYFVLSSLNLIWQPPQQTNVFDKFLFVLVLLIVAGFVWYSYQTTQVEGGVIGGFGIVAYLAFGSVMLFCCIADSRYLMNGGATGQRRLVRHLWRMFFPLFMSTAAFFLGQARHLPEAVQKIEILLFPVLLVILSAIYWVIKVNKRNLKFS